MRANQVIDLAEIHTFTHQVDVLVNQVVHVVQMPRNRLVNVAQHAIKQCIHSFAQASRFALRNKVVVKPTMNVVNVLGNQVVYVSQDDR